MEELKPKEFSCKKALLITVVYFVVVSICAYFHEVWCDEAQVWMLAKHLSVPELLKHLVNEGHPSLFYLLVMPFAKLTDNFIFQKLICLISSAGAIFLLWRYSKFNTTTKTIITLSAPFIYYFPVIARNYSLVPPLIFSIAILYNKQKEHPYVYSILIALLANTHAIMFAFSSLLGLDFLYKNIYLPKKEGCFDKKNILSSLIIFFGLISVVAQVAGTTGNNMYIGYESGTNKIRTFYDVFMKFFFNSFDDYFLRINKRQFTLYSISMLFSMMGAFIWGLRRIHLQSKKLFWFVFVSIGFQLAVYTFTYSLLILPTRIYCAFMILLFAFWVLIEKKQSKIINIIVSLIFALTFINSFKSYYGDIVFDFASATRAAKFMKNNIDPNNSIIYTTDPSIGITLVYNLGPKYTIYTPIGKPLKYIEWKREIYSFPKNETEVEFYKTLRNNNPKKDLYIITSFWPYFRKDINEMDKKYFDLEFISPFSLTSFETAKIWKYKY